MKDGCHVGTYKTAELDDKELVSLMIGRTLESYFPVRKPKIGETVMKLENISSGKTVKNVSFEVRRGEVLGITGLVGAGRTEAMRGVRRRSAGRRPGYPERQASQVQNAGKRR